jgi:circadian clock protein KaiB
MKRRPTKKASIVGDIPAESAQAYVFRLFVSGSTGKSSKAIDNIKRICETHFPGQYQLEVVDVYQQPQLATGEQIIAVPTLVKKAPGREKKILGTLGDTPEFIKKIK